MNETTATRHQRLRRRVRVSGALTGAAILAVVALTPLARLAADWLNHTVSTQVIAAILLVVGLVLLIELSMLPGFLYMAARSRRRQRRSPISVFDVLSAQGQATIVTLALSMAVAAIWSVSVGVAGERWWVLAAVLLAVLHAAGVRVAPAIFARLADVKPLGRRDLASRLQVLASAANVPLNGVHEWRVGDDTGASALVTGTGRARRVLIASPLVRDWSDDEIAVIVAHELAHHRHHDLRVTLAVDAAVAALAAWTAAEAIRRFGSVFEFGGAGDLAALPMLMLVAGMVWMAATPVRHAVSRWQERRADRFALRLTNGADAFSAAIRRLGAQHLAEERPSLVARWFFSRHPAVAERLAVAETYRRRRAS